MSPGVTIEHVSFSYGAAPVLDDVDVAIGAGVKASGIYRPKAPEPEPETEHAGHHPAGGH